MPLDQKYVDCTVYTKVSAKQVNSWDEVKQFLLHYSAQSPGAIPRSCLHLNLSGAAEMNVYICVYHYISLCIGQQETFFWRENLLLIEWHSSTHAARRGSPAAARTAWVPSLSMMAAAIGLPREGFETLGPEAMLFLEQSVIAVPNSLKKPTDRVRATVSTSFHYRQSPQAHAWC